MNVLVTGRGTSGSWIIRGEQLGKAIGAHVEVNANSFKGFDLAVVVKRPRADLLERIRMRGVPWVWDIVDAWPQPEGNDWDKETCMSWLRHEFEITKPKALVAATEAMASDLREFGVPVLTLPHHARPGLRINPIRNRVIRIGYEGGKQYLGNWCKALEEKLLSRDVDFIVNPSTITDLDIVVAIRAQTGYAARNWKSNVKLANAQASGTPCVIPREKGYLETATGSECWADTVDEMLGEIDRLWSRDVRVEVSRGLVQGTLLLDDIAARYKKWLSQLNF